MTDCPNCDSPHTTHHQLLTGTGNEYNTLVDKQSFTIKSFRECLECGVLFNPERSDTE